MSKERSFMVLAYFNLKCFITHIPVFIAIFKQKKKIEVINFLPSKLKGACKHGFTSVT